MIRYILLKNRQLLRTLYYFFFPIGCAFICVFGAMILSSRSTIELPTRQYLLWLGHLLLYGVTIVILMLCLDTIYRIVFLINRHLKRQ